MFLRHGISRRHDLTRSWWEDLFEEADVAQFCLVWEFHVELDVQVAKVVMSVRGHALTFDNLYRGYMLLVSIPKKLFLKGALTGCDWVSREDVDCQPPVIKMLNVDGTTSQSRQEINFSVIEEIIVLALESWVWFLLNFKLNVAREHPRHLITFTSEIDLVACLDPSIYMDVQDFAFYHGFLSQASLAPVFLANRLTLALAVRTDSLESLYHRAHLPHHSLHTGAIAARAGLHGAFFATAAFAGWADYGFLQG
jgi:hypothetical protein